jgi:hypothetical protein
MLANGVWIAENLVGLHNDLNTVSLTPVLISVIYRYLHLAPSSDKHDDENHL